MKLLGLSLVLLFLSLSNARATDCPDFSGKFLADDGEAYSVKQTGCRDFTVSHQEDPQQKPSVDEFFIDGQRHEIQNVFWFAYWNQTTFVREPWSSATGGEQLGFREFWQLQSGNLSDRIVDSSDGSVIKDKIFKKTN